VTDTLLANLRRGPHLRHPADREIARAADRAVSAGAVEVAYAEMDSPVGPLVIAATEDGLVTVAFAASGLDVILDHLAARISPSLIRAPRMVDPARRQIDQYLAGRRRVFEMELDWRLITPFQRCVLEHTAAIPYGQTSTYSDIAVLSGSPRGARATGNALGANPLPIVIPCHRVLPRGGGPGGYAGGTPIKEALLHLEADGS
jgi:methylated-DNA-[protein]-cysteine S-methyltransferase